ncbi:MAG TPA: hypothetical protein DCX53_15080 [Anaerolineae bacterium]|nr:hypothetical protein [Anaerolineae bacterium]
MSHQKHPGIYLIVDFDWPRPFDTEVGKKARVLHETVKNQKWIREAVAGSGGLGNGPGSVWTFWLKDYAALDRLLHDKTDDVSNAYVDFFSSLPKVVEKIREEVVFN